MEQGWEPQPREPGQHRAPQGDGDCGQQCHPTMLASTVLGKADPAESRQGPHLPDPLVGLSYCLPLFNLSTQFFITLFCNKRSWQKKTPNTQPPSPFYSLCIPPTPPRPRALSPSLFCHPLTQLRCTDAPAEQAARVTPAPREGLKAKGCN